jgi:HK97 family phage major capsid protein
MKTSLELKRERKGLVEKVRNLINRVEGENRDLNTEENSEYSALQDAVNSLETRIARLEELEGTEDDLESSASKRDGDEDDKDKKDDAPAERSKTVGGSRGMWEEKSDTRSRDYRLRWLGSLFPELRRGEFQRPEYRDVVLGAIGTDSTGGYFATPTELSNKFVHQLDNISYVRQCAYIEKLTEAKSLGVRQMTTQPTAGWSGEIVQVSPETATTLARRDLSPQLVYSLATISLRELQASSDVESLMMNRMQYQVNAKIETAYVTGSGTGQPLGIFTASASGVPTSQDVASSQSLAKIFSSDDIFKLIYNMPDQYRMSPSFRIFGHRSVAQYIRTLKDGIGQYIWAAGLQPGQPDNLAGHKFCTSEYAPSLNTSSPTASQYVLCAGDMSFYHIADVVGVDSPQLQRLNERYADLNEVGLMFRFWTDGSPVLAQAFSRLQLAAS